MVRWPKFSKRSDHPERTETQVSSGDQSPNIVGDNASVTYIQQLIPLPQVSALHQLPAPPAVFKGRDTELSALEVELTVQDVEAAARLRATVVAGLQGTGGIGKTALAIVLAYRLKDRYPDAQIFLNLRGAGADGQSYGGTEIKPVTPAEAMQSVIHSFKPGAQLPATLNELAPIYYSVLSEPTRVLLVLDNAADAEQVQPLLPPPNCLLLITSRAQFELPGLKPRNLNYLTPDKSHELLLALSPRLAGYESEASELCGHLPLALQVFARAVNEKKLTPVSELIQRLREGRDRLAAVDAAFQISYDLLDQELQRKWRLLAVFPATFDDKAAAAVWETSQSSQGPALNESWARDAMQALFNASLVEWNESNDRFRLHDLVRQFCDSKLSNGERDAGQLRYARYYRVVLEAASELLKHDTKNDDVRKGVEIFEREEVNLNGGVNSLWKRPDREANVVLISLLNLLINAGNVRSYRPGTVKWMERQLEAVRITEDRHAEAMALRNLASAYLNAFDLPGDRGAEKAIPLFKQAISLHSKIHDNKLKAETLDDYAMALMLMGNKKEAIAPAEEAAAIYEEINEGGMARQLRGQVQKWRADISTTTFLKIKNVQLFVGEPESEVQIQALVNKFRYPSVAEVQWQKVGPEMSPGIFEVPSDDRYRVSFDIRLKDSKGERALITPFFDEITASSVPVTKDYSAYELSEVTQEPSVAATLSFEITRVPHQNSC
jgi:tetratricopeptide (TPR) repeat protein